nr:hypothetical protein [Desulfobacterales bacterium]
DERRDGDDLLEEEAAAWSRRRLCSDENCIGVIGADGRCKECGKPYAGEGEAAAAAEKEPAPAAVEPSHQTEEEAPQPEEGLDDWSRRRLCSDENCIGVIGADGRCKECGKPYAG